VSCLEETKQGRRDKGPEQEEECAPAAMAREAVEAVDPEVMAEGRAGTASARLAENECRTASALHVWTSAAQNAVPP